MKKSALVLAAFVLGACAAPTETETVDVPIQQGLSAEPQTPEDIAKAPRRNTYQGNCEKRLVSDLQSAARPDGWDARVLRAASQNRAAGLQPLTTSPQILGSVAVAAVDRPPIESARCDMLFDMTREGVPENIMAHCTSPRFTETAVSQLTSLRFAPAMAGGVARKRHGVITDITMCTNRG